jgi:hypothetical protein
LVHLRRCTKFIEHANALLILKDNWLINPQPAFTFRWNVHKQHKSYASQMLIFSVAFFNTISCDVLNNHCSVLSSMSGNMQEVCLMTMYVLLSFDSFWRASHSIVALKVDATANLFFFQFLYFTTSNFIFHFSTFLNFKHKQWRPYNCAK